MKKSATNIFFKYFFLTEYGDKIFKSIILATVILCLCYNHSIADKRTDFIPSHKVVQLDSLKTSLVGKGTTVKVVKEIVPEKFESKLTDTLNVIAEPKKTEKKSGKREPVYRGQIAKKNNEKSKQRLLTLDTLSVGNSLRDTIVKVTDLIGTHTILQSSDGEKSRDTSQTLRSPKAVIKTLEEGRKARIINVVAIVFVLVVIVFFALQSSGFFSKRSTTGKRQTTFSASIGDSNEEVVTYSRPTHKNIFDTISEREVENSEKNYEQLVHESEDELIEYHNANLPVNQDTIHIAKKFRRGQGEVELAMKMSSHRSNISQYAEKIVQLPSFENETPTGRKKDAGAIAKKLGIGKGEVLLARHLEEIEHKHTKG